MTKWPDTLRELMLSHNETQEILAEHLNVTQGIVGHWLNNRRQPRMQTLQRIADHYKVSVQSLLGGLQEEPKSIAPTPLSTIPIKKRAIPYLENCEIIDFVQNANSLLSYRSYEMPLTEDFKISKLSYLVEITDDVATTSLFPTRLPGLGIFAIIDADHQPNAQDLSMVCGADKINKLCQCVLNGGEKFFKPYDQSPLMKYDKNVIFLGTVRNISYLPIDKETPGMLGGGKPSTT